MSHERRLIEAAQAQEFSSSTLGSLDRTRPASTSFVPDLPPDVFGGYDVIRELHRGGQGVVYEAIQRGTRREVAIKVLHEGPFAGPKDKARFDREVQILGKLQHPNIVTIHHAGQTRGCFYFVMDRVVGLPLDEYVRNVETSKRQNVETPEPRASARAESRWPGTSARTEVRGSPQEILRLFAKICEAVAAAHVRGILHRDLKPGNILVDEHGEPHVLDFGLAKLTAERDQTTRSQTMTVTGQFVGSLPWASPEQADGSPDAIDLRSDVYSLGIVLYQMLTGGFPYPIVGKMRDVLRHIIETEPRPPRSLDKEVDDEVETIVLKCLAKDAERRYQSAGELGRDIRRYLADEPIDAKRDSTFYVLRKQMRRYRVPLLVAAGFVVLLIASSVVAWSLYLKSQHRLRDSYLAQAHATRVGDKPGRRFNALDALTKAAAIRPSIELRDEAIAAMALTDVQIIKEVDSEIGPSSGAVGSGFSHNGALNWFKHRQTGQIVVRRFADNRVLLTVSGPPDGANPCVSRDERYLATASAASCQVWDIEHGSIVKEISVDAPPGGNPLDFSPDGNELAVGTKDGSIHIHSLSSDEVRVLPPVHAPSYCVRYDPTGAWLATCSPRSNDVSILDARTGQVVRTLIHPAVSWHLAWSLDGSRLAVGCHDGHVHTWNTRTGQRQFTLRGHMSDVSDVGFNATGSLLFSSSWDGTTRLWDPQLGTALLTIPQTHGLQFLGDSDRLGFSARRRGSTVGVAKITGQDAFRALVGHAAEEAVDRCQWVRISTDGRLIAAACNTGVRLWDSVHGQQIAFLPTIGKAYCAVFRADGTDLVTVSEEGVWHWPIDIESGITRIGPPRILLRQYPDTNTHTCVTADNKTVVVAFCTEGYALVFDVDRSGEPRRIGPHALMRYLALSPDDKWLATGAWRGEGVKIWNLATGQLVRELPVNLSATVNFSPDGKWLVTSEAEHVIWRTDTWQPEARFARNSFNAVPGPTAFAPDSRILAAVESAPPCKLLLVDLTRMERIATLESAGSISMPESLFFTPDGRRLIFPNPQEGHILHVWDLYAIRKQLAAMNLDWDVPPYSPVPAKNLTTPLRTEVDLGQFAVPE